MSDIEIKIDSKKLEQAIKRNPSFVARETKTFLYRVEKRLESKTGSAPWRVGEMGGGSPVKTGNLLRSHKAKREPFSLTWFQDEKKAPYGKYVHGIKGFPRKRSYKLRPWLEWVKTQSEKQISDDTQRLLRAITEDLAK
jgi:hypothetical protein